MLITYEKFVDYIEMLKTIEKDTPVFISNITAKDEFGYITTSIILQVLREDICCQKGGY